MYLQLMINSSQQNATRSPLLRLPAEIRIMVFGYVFQDEDYYTGSGYPIYSMQEHPSLRRDLGLLLFSRQLYREAASLPYKLAVFRLDFHRYHDLWEFFVGKVKGADWSHGSSRMLR